MIPPVETNVLDKHGGFTCVSKIAFSGRKWIEYSIGPNVRRFKTNPDQQQNILEAHLFETLWRPGAVLKGKTTGKLLSYSESSFYQNNDDVTLAFYEVPGYGYVVACWFENDTGNRADGNSYLFKKARIQE